jgi:hypothetical protein
MPTPPGKRETPSVDPLSSRSVCRFPLRSLRSLLFQKNLPCDVPLSPESKKGNRTRLRIPGSLFDVRRNPPLRDAYRADDSDPDSDADFNFMSFFGVGVGIGIGILPGHYPRSPLAVGRWTLDVRRSTFGVRRSAFDVRRSTFGVRRSAFDVRRSTFGVRCSAFDVRRSTFDVRRSAFDVRRSMFGVNRSVLPPQKPTKETKEIGKPSV